jgi:hypothetical protein
MKMLIYIALQGLRIAGLLGTYGMLIIWAIKVGYWIHDFGYQVIGASPIDYLHQELPFEGLIFWLAMPSALVVAIALLHYLGTYLKPTKTVTNTDSKRIES